MGLKSQPGGVQEGFLRSWYQALPSGLDASPIIKSALNQPPTFGTNIAIIMGQSIAILTTSATKMQAISSDKYRLLVGTYTFASPQFRSDIKI